MKQNERLARVELLLVHCAEEVLTHPTKVTHFGWLKTLREHKDAGSGLTVRLCFLKLLDGIFEFQFLVLHLHYDAYPWRPCGLAQCRDEVPGLFTKNTGRAT